MAAKPSQAVSDERRAVLGLWSVPGIGSKSIEVIRRHVGDLRAVIDQEVSRWSRGIDLPLPALKGLAGFRHLAPLADAVLESTERGQMGVAFRGDPAYPGRLAEASNSPPLLFFRGPPCTARPRVAMVGSRKVSPQHEESAMAFAQEVARYGVGIVSGAAEGIDTACHMGALNAHGETWAILGSALDRLDPGPRAIQDKMLPRGGTVYSEYPPGLTARPETFPRRNRLISGSSDVVLVLRAGIPSGAAHTVKYAVRQGRPVLAIPGEVKEETAAGGNQLIHDGVAAACLSPADVFKALKLEALATVAPPRVPCALVSWKDVSADAQTAFAQVRREPTTFEDVLHATQLPSGALASALCELELLGLVVQRPGKRYEKA